MADIFTKQKRSEIMSRIRPKGTRPEQILFAMLRKEKVVFRKHYKKLSGTPDAAVISKKVAIFVDGDFWHGWRFARWSHKLPKEYWRQKIADNIARDRRTFARIRYRGWTVVRIWEHQLKQEEREKTRLRLLAVLNR